MNRKTFSFSLYLFLILLTLSGCTSLQKVSDKRILMGTEVEIIVYDYDILQAEFAINSAFEEIKRVENIFSIYSNQSEAYKLNEQGFLENASPELIYLINLSDYYSELSNGSFDITVQPLLDRWSLAKEGNVPTDDEIKDLLTLVNYKNIIIDGKNIKFKKNGMKITLGAIAKGYAIDRAVEILKVQGIKTGMVNAGGDIYVFGNKPGNELWNIALQNPRNKSNFLTEIKITDNAVTTSGDYERYFIEKKAHHIMDPKTGNSALELISVTIITNNATNADALATAVFVLGPQKGLKLIENIKQEKIECLLITKDKLIIKSADWPE